MHTYMQVYVLGYSGDVIHHEHIVSNIHRVIYRPAVCIFYLILRALDTVEDDMSIPEDKKVPMLKEFYTRLQEPQWKFMDSKEKDKAVLEEFPVVRKLDLYI